MDSFFINRTKIQSGLYSQTHLPPRQFGLQELKYFSFKMDHNLIPIIGLSHIKAGSRNVISIKDGTEINIPLYKNISMSILFRYASLFDALLYCSTYENHLLEYKYKNIKYYGGSGLFLDSKYKLLIVACTSISEDGYTFLFSDSIYKENNNINKVIKNKIIPDSLDKGFKCIITNIDDYIKFPKMQFENQEEIEKILKTEDFINKVTGSFLY